MHHCSFVTLVTEPVMNVKTDGPQLVVAYDAEVTSSLWFERRLGDRELTFVSVGEGKLRDEQTKALWNRATGLAFEGELAGKRLKPHIGIMSFKRAWLTFHPDSNKIE